MDVLKLEFLSLCFISQNTTDGRRQPQPNLSSVPALSQIIVGELQYPLKRM